MTGFMPEGRGGGKWAGWKEAKGEYVMILDEDNILEGEEVINNLLSPLESDKSLFGSHCMLKIHKGDPLINRYISLVGTDPVFAYRSLDGKFGHLPFIRSLENHDNHYVLTMRLGNLLVTGGNCFMYRKSCVDEIGGYVQDTDNIFAYTQKHGGIRIAIPKRTLTHHLAAINIHDFLKKKFFWSARPSSKRWRWIPDDALGMMQFTANLICNLTLVINFYTAIRNTIRDKESAWLLHPIMAFATTMIYGYHFLDRFLKQKIFKEQGT
jgi:hypothetical protein